MEEEGGIGPGRAGGYAGYVSEASDDDQCLNRMFRTTDGGGRQHQLRCPALKGNALASFDQGLVSFRV